MVSGKLYVLLPWVYNGHAELRQDDLEALYTISPPPLKVFGFATWLIWLGYIRQSMPSTQLGRSSQASHLNRVNWTAFGSGQLKIEAGSWNELGVEGASKSGSELGKGLGG